MNDLKCTKCDVETGKSYELNVEDFYKRFLDHEREAFDGEYHKEFVEGVCDVLIDKLIASENNNVGKIRAMLIRYLDEEFKEESE